MVLFLGVVIPYNLHWQEFDVKVELEQALKLEFALFAFSFIHQSGYFTKWYTLLVWRDLFWEIHM